jgi:hypothetical protein
METKGISVQLSIKEIYDAACPKCKEKIRALVKAKLTDDMVNKVIGA